MNEIIKEIIIKEIESNGHLTIDQFTEIAMQYPKHGYYQNNEIINKDFTTAPEISQLFGEIIAVNLVNYVKEDLADSKFILLELGPGKGSLLDDMLRIFSKLIPNLKNQLQAIYLLESNARLKEFQQQKLAKYNLDIKWLENLNDLPTLPIIGIANEFLDALPIKQYIKINDNWHEMVVKFKDDRFFLDSIPTQDQEYLLKKFSNCKNNDIVEKSLVRENIFADITGKIKQNKGKFIWIDYGYNLPTRFEDQYKSTLQAVKNNEYSSIFEDIGHSDITSHVDFNSLIKICDKENYAYNFSNQKEFLINNGILIRHQMIIQNLVKNNRLKDIQEVQSSLERLISSNMMGEIFKVIEINY